MRMLFSIGAVLVAGVLAGGESRASRHQGPNLNRQGIRHNG